MQTIVPEQFPTDTRITLGLLLLCMVTTRRTTWLGLFLLSFLSPTPVAPKFLFTINATILLNHHLRNRNARMVSKLIRIQLRRRIRINRLISNRTNLGHRKGRVYHTKSVNFKARLTTLSLTNFQIPNRGQHS